MSSPRISAGSVSSADKPAANDRPHTGDKLASVARVSSSRSVLAFGVVRSCGSTPPAPSSTTSNAPITPTTLRAFPVESVNFMRYNVKDGTSSRTNMPLRIHSLNIDAACSYAFPDGASGISTWTMLFSCLFAKAKRSASERTSYGGEQTSCSAILLP